MKLFIVWAEEDQGKVTAAYRVDNDPTVKQITLPAEKNAEAWINKAFPLIRAMRGKASPLVEELRSVALSGAPISDEDESQDVSPPGS